MTKRKNYSKGNSIGDMLINLKELEQVPVFKKAKDLKVEREERVKQRIAKRRLQKAQAIERENRESIAQLRNANRLREGGDKPFHKVNALERLEEMQRKLNRAPIGRMTLVYDANMIFERLKIKDEEFVPYIKEDFTGLMKVIRGTNEPIMEISLDELFVEFGDEDVVRDLGLAEKIK